MKSEKVNMFEYIIVKENDIEKLVKIKEFDYDGMPCEEDDVIFILNKNYHMDILDNEFSYVVAFDNYDRMLGVFQVSKGNNKSCNMYRRSIGVFLLLIGAKKFAVYHNHPDDISIPSSDDINNIPQLEMLGKLLEITFLNSFIITKSGWTDVRNNIYYPYDIMEVI